MSDNDTRPDPDQLLSVINRAEQKESKGKLKIFLGMAAGVGKTFSMLKAAKEAKIVGIDVVVGVVETHGRKETNEQLSGLEVLARKKIEHKGVMLEELDLDAVLARKPQLVLIDELAHTNAPGGRHTKRYLDILEIIAAGIDVFTTINIQHLDSRIDTVKQITGIVVHESVPDSFFDQASEVVLIDLSPDELLRRLQEGRIYPRERIQTAEQNFFKKGNLTALREMALRLAAERVDRELRDYKQLHGIEDVWKSRGRLMVAISGSPYSETLIRWTRRFADLTDSTWVGVCVDHNQTLSDSEKTLLAKNVSLVHQLGGEVVSTKDTNVVSALLRVARQQNVTQIIVGKSRTHFFEDLFHGGSIVHRLLKKSDEIDIYCVSPTEDAQKLNSHPPKFSYRFPWGEMGGVVAVALAAWGFASLLYPLIDYFAVGIVFLLAVCFAGLIFSRTAVILLAVVLSQIHNFFFIPPIHTFIVSRPEDFMMLLLFFVTAATIGHLTTQLKAKERILRVRERQALVLYELTKNLAQVQSIEDVLKMSVRHMAKISGCDVVISLVGPKGGEKGLQQHSSPHFSFDAKENAVAQWVIQNAKPAGKFTDTLSAARGFYLPLIGKFGSLGVLGMDVKKHGQIDSEQLLLIETCLRQVAFALEREYFHAHTKF